MGRHFVALSITSWTRTNGRGSAAAVCLGVCLLPRFAEWEPWNIAPEFTGSVRLRAGGLDHHAPLLGLFGNSLPKSAAEPASTVPPKSASRAFSLGPARIAGRHADPGAGGRADPELNGSCPVTRSNLNFINSPAVASRATNGEGRPKIMGL